MFSTLFLLTFIASVMYFASAMVLVSFFDINRERERERVVLRSTTLSSETDNRLENNA